MTGRPSPGLLRWEFYTVVVLVIAALLLAGVLATITVLPQLAGSCLVGLSRDREVRFEGPGSGQECADFVRNHSSDSAQVLVLDPHPTHYHACVFKRGTVRITVPSGGCGLASCAPPSPGDLCNELKHLPGTHLVDYSNAPIG